MCASGGSKGRSKFFHFHVTGYQIASLGFSHCEIQGFYRAGKFNYFLSKMQLSSPGDHISVVFSIKLPLKLIWLKVSSAFNLEQGQQGNFPSLSCGA